MMIMAGVKMPGDLEVPNGLIAFNKI